VAARSTLATRAAQAHYARSFPHAPPMLHAAEKFVRKHSATLEADEARAQAVRSMQARVDKKAGEADLAVD
jgi:hypothetical protein